MTQQPINVPESGGSKRPHDEIEIYDKAVSATVPDEFLEQGNFGLGFYKNREMWLQAESFKKGMYGAAAFASIIIQRAEHQTKYQLAREAWEELPIEERQERDRRQFLEEEMENQWAALEPDDPALDEDQRRHVGLQRKWQKIAEYSGIDREWTPPHWRMLMARHEFSRSRDARLVDNIFGRVREFLGSNDELPDREGVFGGGG